MKIVLVTGGFDPIHSGHISYLNHAQHEGEMLIVGLNSDAWLERKKGRSFMSWRERMVVLDNLHMVDNVIEFDDSDDTAIDAINKVKAMYPDDYIIFANGGDRTAGNILERYVPDVHFMFGVGGTNKANSSSWILEEWKAPKTERTWGYYRVLHEVPGTKVKELTIEPGQSISLQRHQHRNEYWHVSSGQVVAESYMNNGYRMPSVELKTHDSYKVPAKEWHRLYNPYTEPVKIVEIQYGAECTEHDIERK
jgi:cytidyltransferase-like protein